MAFRVEFQKQKSCYFVLYNFNNTLIYNNTLTTQQYFEGGKIIIHPVSRMQDGLNPINERENRLDSLTAIEI